MQVNNLQETIKISVNGEPKQTNEPIKMSMKVRKTIDGNIMIMDHSHIDIVVLPNEKKIVTFVKGDFGDNVYSTQDRFFNYLSKMGIIQRDSIQAGNVYGAMEAIYPEAVNGADATQLTIFSIGKFLEKEKPHLDMENYVDDEFEKDLTNPDEEESTDFGEVPQAAQKGSIRSSNLRYLTNIG